MNNLYIKHKITKIKFCPTIWAYSFLILCVCVLVSINTFEEGPKVITSLSDISTKKYYRICASHLTVIRKGITWLQIEDQAMENETLLAVDGVGCMMCQKNKTILIIIVHKYKIACHNFLFEFDTSQLICGYTF